MAPLWRRVLPRYSTVLLPARARYSGQGKKDWRRTSELYGASRRSTSAFGCAATSAVYLWISNSAVDANAAFTASNERSSEKGASSTTASWTVR